MAHLEELHAQWERAVEREKPADAIKALVELEKLESKDAIWSHRLGDAYRRAGRHADAVEAFVRAMDRYKESGFVPRAIAMAKLVESIDPKRTGLMATLSSARPRPQIVPEPLRRAPDALPDEVRFSDAGDRSSLEIVLEDIDLEIIEEIRSESSAPAPIPAPEEPSVDRVAVMAGFRLFSGLNRDALVALAEASELVEFAPNAIVVARDELAFALYSIIEGSARVEVHGGGAVRLGEGEVFGEACLLDEGRRQADVRAETQLTTLRIDKRSLDAIVAAHPEIEQALFGLLARRLVANLVASSPLFASFEPSVRLELAQMFEARQAAAGLVLAEFGKRTDGLYVVLAGEVIAEGAEGMMRIARGTAFGQGSLLSGAPSKVTVSTETEAVVLRLPASRFSTLAAMYPPALAHLAETADDPMRPSLV